MRTTRRFRTGGGEPSQARRFRLPEAQRAAPAYAPKFEALPGQDYRHALLHPEPPAPVKAQTPARSRTQKAAVETINAPKMDTSPLATVSLRVASELAMPGFMGSVKLLCGPENHNMQRLRLGVMPLLRQHNDDAPIGRVNSLMHVKEPDGWAITGEAEIADFPRAQEALAEVRAGARRGVSPGFILHEIEFDDDFNMTVTQSEIYECSVVTGAKNYGARVLGMEAAMNAVAGPEIVSTSDLVGMSIQAARVAVRDGKGTERQRIRLSSFLKTFDDLMAQGQSRDAAVMAAKASAGI